MVEGLGCGMLLGSLDNATCERCGGVQLSELTDAQKNELALLVAERGVVVFRDQDFKDVGARRQKSSPNTLAGFTFM
jgi:hypothetical protein